MLAGGKSCAKGCCTPMCHAASPMHCRRRRRRRRAGNRKDGEWGGERQGEGGRGGGGEGGGGPVSLSASTTVRDRDAATLPG